VINAATAFSKRSTNFQESHRSSTTQIIAGVGRVYQSEKKTLKKVSHGGSEPQWRRSQEPMASKNGSGPRPAARTAARATHALHRSASSYSARHTSSAHMRITLPTSPIFRRTAHSHAHSTPTRARRARSRAPTRAAAHGTPLQRARDANVHASPRRGAPRATPRITVTSRIPSFPPSPCPAPPRIPQLTFGFL
jgi:hypothetical protein